MRSKSDYKRAVRVVREVVHAWDPYRLIAGGAPDDEFDHEIASVVAQIPRIRSARDASHALSRVFSSSFGPIRARALQRGRGATLRSASAGRTLPLARNGIDGRGAPRSAEGPVQLGY